MATYYMIALFVAILLCMKLDNETKWEAGNIVEFLMACFGLHAVIKLINIVADHDRKGWVNLIYLVLMLVQSLLIAQKLN